jgi:hypothetical protein
VSLHRTVDPAIAKSLADHIRSIGKTAKSEEDVRLNVEAALKHYLGRPAIPTSGSALRSRTTILNEKLKGIR